MIKRAFLIVALLGLVAGATGGLDLDLENDIVRLGEMRDGVGVLRVETDLEAFTCSATAIDTHYWLTAGHCTPAFPSQASSQASSQARELLIHPIQGSPTPADPWTRPPYTIDESRATLVNFNEKYAIYYRYDPISHYFPLAPGQVPQGTIVYVYVARERRTLFASEKIKMPIRSVLLEKSPFQGHDMIVQGGAMPGFSGSGFIVKINDEYYIAGVLDAINVGLYVIYYMELPIVGTAESPYSLGYSVDGDLLRQWIAEHEAKRWQERGDHR